MLSRTLYTALLYITSPLIFSLLLRTKKGKPPVGQRWKEFIGITPTLSHKPLWVHAVSVGEVIAATPIIQALQQRYPEQRILVTTTTSTGAERVEALGGNVEHRYFPADYPFAIKLFLSRIQPSICLIMETELWPNMLTICNKRKIPTVIINARLSEKSQQKYLRFKALFDSPLQQIDRILCQNKDDNSRFQGLGLPEEKLVTTGTVKFDISFSEDVVAAGLSLRAKLGADRPVLIAASTHKGEDEIVLRSFQQIKNSHPDALLILVPRHPERFDDVATLCQSFYPATARRSEMSEKTDLTATDIYLGDTMGEMGLLLSACDIAFIGGSLLGDKVGGHNLLEPAALQKPVLTGPSYYNFADVTEQLLQRGGVKVVDSETDLANTVITLINDKTSANTMGIRAKSVCEDNKGALDNIMRELAPFLKKVRN